MPATHQRTLIRQAVKAILIGTGPSYATAAGTRVFDSRAVPFERLDLPAIAFYMPSEEIETDRAPRELFRTAELHIEAMVREPGGPNGAQSVEDALDAMALQIERAMHADWTLTQTCSNSEMQSAESEVFEQGNKLVGLLRLVYSVAYYTYAPDSADVPLPDFDTADVVWDLNNAQGDPRDEAEDTLNNLET